LGNFTQQSGTTSSLIDTLAHLWSVRTYRHLALSVGLFTAIVYTFYAFGAAFYFRSHGMSTSESGFWLGLLLPLLCLQIQRDATFVGVEYQEGRAVPVGIRIPESACSVGVMALSLSGFDRRSALRYRPETVRVSTT